MRLGITKEGYSWRKLTQQQVRVLCISILGSIYGLLIPTDVTGKYLGSNCKPSEIKAQKYYLLLRLFRKRYMSKYLAL